MQIDFNKPLIGLNGQAAKDENGSETTLGKILASVLANSNKGNALKFMDWARKMWNGEVLNMDRADRKMLTEFIETSEVFVNLTKDALLDLLNKDDQQ